MLKKVLTISLSLLLLLPAAAHMEDTETVETVSNDETEVNIVVDEDFNAEQEAIEENEQEIVIEESETEQVEEIPEEVVEEVQEEETTEPTEEIGDTSEVVVEDQNVEATETEVTDELEAEDDKLVPLSEDEEAAIMPKMMMAMALPKLGASSDHNIITDEYPITFKFTWLQIQQGVASANVIYTFNGNGWVENYSMDWDQNAYGWYKLDNSGSENNVFVTMLYTPVVTGSKLKLFKDIGETDSGIDPSFSSWTVAKAESQTYAGRFKSRMRNCDNDNQKWTFGMSGWGRQRIWSASGKGTAVTKVVDESNRDGICTFSGYWGVICKRSSGTTIINTDELDSNGGILGTVTLRIEYSHDWFYEFLD